MTVIGWPKQADTDPYAFVPSPETCWQIAVDGGVRMSIEAKANALQWAAVQAEADHRFITQGENWVTVRRLMHPSVVPDHFGRLITAVENGFGPVIRLVAEQLVQP